MALLLFLVFIVLPLAELYVIIQVGQAIGILPTLALLLVDGIVGASVARSQGRLAWMRFNEVLASGRAPAREVADGAMIMFGGALLLSPGFLTDILGFALLLPPSRAVIRSVIKRTAAKTPTGRPVFFFYDRFGGQGGRGPGAGSNDGDGPGAPPRPAQPPRSAGYDVEGSAREIPEDESELPAGEGDDRG